MARIFFEVQQNSGSVAVSSILFCESLEEGCGTLGEVEIQELDQVGTYMVK